MKTLRIIASLLSTILFAVAAALVTGGDFTLWIGGMLALNLSYNLAIRFNLILPFSHFGVTALFADLEWAEGQDNVPGTGTIFYYALKSDIDNFPEPIAAPANMGEYAKLESDVGFTFTQNGWFKIYGTEGTGKGDFEGQGEPDCQSFLNRFTFNYPGTVAEAKGLCRQLNNSDVVFLGVEFDGTKVLVGHPRIGTKFTMTGTTGDSRTSQKGCTITVECTHEVPLPIYDGDVTLASSSS